MLYWPTLIERCKVNSLIPNRSSGHQLEQGELMASGEKKKELFSQAQYAMQALKKGE